jgi:hypothetical protein
MAVYIHLDSSRRDFRRDINPAGYDLSSTQVDGWFRDRTINFKAPMYHNPSTTTFSTLNIVSLVLPYIVGVTDTLLSEPHIYVNIEFLGIPQRNLVNIPNGPPTGLNYPYLDKIKFICNISGVQADAAAVSKWIHFRPLFEQILLADITKPIRIEMFTRDGTAITIVDPGLALVPKVPDPAYQTFITLEVQPYSRDVGYSHVTE